MIEKAIVGAGCFWGVEDIFSRQRGVIEVKSGYAGGYVNNPTYQLVCSGTTGHAEVVQIAFDTQQTSYQQLLDFFWSMHNPTTLNKQGPDVGTQYRSIILCLNSEQMHQALESKNKAQTKISQAIVTEISMATPFYEAEEYHQQYHKKHGGSCFI